MGDNDGSKVEPSDSGKDPARRGKRADEDRLALCSRLEQIYHSSPVGYLTLDEDGFILEANRTISVLLGMPLESLLEGQRVRDFVLPEDVAVWMDARERLYATGEKQVLEVRFRRGDGSVRWGRAEAILIEDAQSGTRQFSLVISDVTDRKSAEEASRSSEESFKALFMSIPEGFYVSEVIRDAAGEPCDYRYLEVNTKFALMLGVERESLIGKRYREIVPVDTTSWLDTYFAVARDGMPRTYEFYSPEYRMHFETYSYQLAGDRVCVLVMDVTARKTADEERRKLEEQLAQAQKMESVGRLAGGVAHDFNNMLGVILGQAEMALDLVGEGDPLRRKLQEISRAASYSADLTRQLLAFARKQTISPRLLDLNAAVAGMLGVLKRLIGEDIELAWLPGGGLWPVMMDPGQIDQILANLCVNSRDAIDGVGKITIETGNAVFDEAACLSRPGYLAGEYVSLVVSDNGRGMGMDVIERLFEPFFTTKAIGKGTGLGLATVYGIVKQNDGFINVYSEPGNGTSMKIYFKRNPAESPGVATEAPKASVASGDETILLVEDDPLVLGMTADMLVILGYSVIPASTPNDALRMAGERDGRIELLITDTVMPEMNGLELAKRLSGRYPGLACLFMSGYTANVIAHHGVLDEGVHFIQKPFTIRDLGDKVRKALGEKA
jgi:PAS domain S-box-containing protein